MAFYDLKPVRVFDEASGRTYVIGDMFAVYDFGTDRPTIYSWDMMDKFSDERKTLVFSMGKTDYKLPKSSYTMRADYFRTIAIVESMQRKHNFAYDHLPRVLPLKSEYIESDISGDAYIGEGMIDENDTAAAFIMMMNIKLVKVLWLVAILIMLLVFGGLHLFIGVTRDNILYFIPISIAVGGIITLIVYLICHAVARNKFQRLAGSDPAVEELLSFAICPQGYAACESCVYDAQEIVPWKSLDYFIETDKIYIFYKDGNAVVYMPKKAFDKKYHDSVSDMIALHLEQR